MDENCITYDITAYRMKYYREKIRTQWDEKYHEYFNKKVQEWRCNNREKYNAKAREYGAKKRSFDRYWKALCSMDLF